MCLLLLACKREGTSPSGPSVTPSGSPNWRIAQQDGRRPPALIRAAASYDDSRKQWLVFGGFSLPTETWQFDGARWLPYHGPAPDTRIVPPVLVYDRARKNHVLFGGSSSSNDTWTWNGKEWRHQATKVAPIARTETAAAYDVARAQVVLFGGNHCQHTGGENGTRRCGPSDDTWVWDGSHWEPRFGKARPHPREGHTMAYDTKRKEIVLFGGMGQGGQRLADTWVWDGETWAERAPQTSPPARDHQGMAYDEAREQLVMFGGYWWQDGRAGKLQDTWTWNGATWSHRSTEAEPTARSGHTLAYDAERRVVMLVGGQGEGDIQERALQDPWEWNGTKWTDVSTRLSPMQTTGHSLAYDSDHRETILFGGSGTAWLSNETWAWDGARWTKKQVAVAPDARIDAQLVHDPERHRVVLWGGRGEKGPLTDTWLWDGKVWAKAADAPISSGLPPVFDAVRRRIVFGDPKSARMWSWDGSSWVAAAVAQMPHELEGAAAAFDAARGLVVLFGGSDRPACGPIPHIGTRSVCAGCKCDDVNDLWTFDGTAWTRVQANGAWPSERRDHTMVYDTKRKVVVLTGGSVRADGDTTGDATATWEWDGKSWHRATSVGPKVRGRGQAMVYDEARGQIVLFGGANSLGETWVY
jgi:hypothetical protein